MSWEHSVYTAAGTEMLLKSMEGKRLSITKAVSGTGTVSESILDIQTNVLGEAHDLELMGMDTVGDGDDEARRLRIRITGASDSYVMHQIGIFGRTDDSEQDILLMLLQDDHGIEIPSADSDREFEIVFSVALAISRKAQIVLSLNADMLRLEQFIRDEINISLDAIMLMLVTGNLTFGLYTSTGDVLCTSDGSVLTANKRI